MLTDQGAKVFLETHKSLVRLLEGMDGVSEVFVCGTKLITTDFQLPVMSLPNRFATTLDQIPASVPYLPFQPTSIVDVGSEIYTIEITGAEEKVKGFLDLLRPLGIKEVVRSGRIAISRGTKSLN